MSEYTQGVCGDGAAILKDGQPMTVEQILEALQERDELRTRQKLGSDKDYVVVNGLLQCLVDIGNEVGVAPEEQLNGALEIIDAISETKGERDALASKVEQLEDAVIKALDATEFWSHAHTTLKRVTLDKPATSLARRDSLKQREAVLEMANDLAHEFNDKQLEIIRKRAERLGQQAEVHQ